MYARNHIETLELENGKCHDYPNENHPHDDMATNEGDYDDGICMCIIVYYVVLV